MTTKTSGWRRVWAWLMVTVVLIMALAGWFVTSGPFWQWVGRQLVAAVNERINGEMTVGAISGNLVTGLKFADVSLRYPPGGEILRVGELTVSLSLGSLVKLQPVIGVLRFREPHLVLSQDDQGRWNWAGLRKERPPPPVSAILLPAIQVRQGTVEFHRPDRDLDIRELELDLDLAVAHPGRPAQVISIRQGRIAGRPAGGPRLALEARLSLAAAAVELEHLGVEAAGKSALTARGTVENLPERPAVDLKVQLQPVEGGLLRDLWASWPPGLSPAGEVEISGDLENLKVQGDVHLPPGRFTVKGELNLASRSRPTYDFSVNFSGLSPEFWRAAGGEKLAESGLSPVSGTLTARGAGWPPAGGPLQAKLRLNPFRYRQAEVSAGELELTVRDPVKQEVSARVQGNFGQASLTAAGRLLPGGSGAPGVQGEATVTAEGFNPGVFMAPGGPAAKVSGRFTGQFALPSATDPSRGTLAGTLKAAGSWGGQAVQDLTVAGEWKEAQLRVREARLLMTGLRASGQGTLGRQGANMQVALELGPGPWPPPLGVRGQARLSGTLSGPLAALNFQIKGDGRNVAWNKVALGGFSLAATGTWIVGGLPRLNLEATATDIRTPAAPLERLTVSARTQDQRLLFDLTMAQSRGPAGEMAGSLERQAGAYLLSLSTLSLGRPPEQIRLAEPVQVKIFSSGGWETSPATLTYRDGTVKLAGRATPGGVDLRLTGERLPVAALKILRPEWPALEGALNLQVDVGGTMTTPELRGQIDVSPGRIVDWRFEQLFSRLAYRGGAVSLEGHLREKTGGPALRWSGEMPLRLSLSPPSWGVPAEPMRVNLQSENVDLAILAALVPQVSAAQSPVTLQAQITGTLTAPEAKGSLKWGEGFVTLKVAGTPYELEAGELRLEGDRIVLPQLVLRSGEGQGTLGGSLTLAGTPPAAGNLRLTLSNFTVLHRAEARAVVDGHSELAVSGSHLNLNGRFTLQKGNFVTSFFRPEKHREIKVLPLVCFPGERRGAGTLWRNMGMHLVLEIPGGLWVRDRNMRVEGRGQLTAIKEPGQNLALGGKLQAVQGSFTIQGKIFKLEQASLTFPGVPDKAAMLDARAQFPLDEVTLFLVAAGPLDNLHPRIESIPPMSQRDVLSYLLFDRPASSLTRDQYLSAGEKAAGILGGLAAQKVKDVFGEGLPLIGELTPTGGKDTVGVGRKLTKDITISYERKLNPLRTEDVDQIRVDYKINKYFSVESQVGKRNTGGDVFFNLDF